MEFYEILSAVRAKRPLIQCITNFVTVNDCANILLAAGASPTMAQDIREVEEAVSGVDGLVCNLGAIDLVDSMLLAGKRANTLGIPVVLDPVAAGGTTLRRELSARLLREVRFAAIRGNASEIRALAGQESRGSGVDTAAVDAITEETLPQSAEMVRALAERTGAVIAVSGAVDMVSDGTRVVLLRNGCATMTRVTGTGCMLTTLIGAFCAATPDAPLEAVCAAMTAMGICGEIAEEKRLRNHTGSATFRVDLIDALFNLTESQMKERSRYAFYKG